MVHVTITVDWLTDSVFYAISAIFQPCTGGHYCWLIDWLFCVKPYRQYSSHVPAAITVERLQSGGIFIMQNMLWTGLRFCCLIQRTTLFSHLVRQAREILFLFMVRDGMVRVGAKIRFGQIHGYRRFHSKFLHG